MNTIRKIQVRLKKGGYPILVGKGIFSCLGKELGRIGFPKRVFVVTNPAIGGLYLEKVVRVLEKEGFTVSSFSALPADESAKSGTGLFAIYGKMLESRLDRSSGLVALGGGVVGDVSGFAASTFMRGIPWAVVPTTLLAQVDSAIGGKTAINLPEGKNLAGTFYQPSLVFSDVELLKTLPAAEIRHALAEVIKYGMIWDRRFFEYLEKNILRAVNGDAAVLETIVAECSKIKAAVVSRDEKETTGLRAILNYGHTFAHAFEAASGKWSLSHGEAVALGMTAAAKLAAGLALFPEAGVERQETLIRQAGLPVNLSREVALNQIFIHMAHDKKAEKGKLKFILPVKIGQVKPYASIPSKIVLEAVEALYSG